MRGTGRPLLFISGPAGGLRRRPNVLDLPLVDRFQVLADDQRGLGSSDKPDVPYTVADCAVDAEALLGQVLSGLEASASDFQRAIGSKRQHEARMVHDAYDRLDRLRMPVLVCGGLYDGIVQVENLRALNRRTPNSRLDLFQGGHLFYLQDPTAMPRIIQFLKGG